MQLMYPAPIWADIYNTSPLNSSTPQLAQLFTVPKSGTINQLAVQLGTITTSDTMQLSLQTVNSSGSPTGTLYGSSAAQTFTPSAGSLNSVTLSTPATATEGDLVALVVGFSSTIGSVNVGYSDRTYFGNGITTFPYSLSYNGSSWSKSNTSWCMYLGYNDSTYPDIDTIPVSAAGSFTFAQNLGSSPDEYGLYFQMPMKALVEGVWVFSYANNISPYDTVKLYSTDGATVLASANLSQGQTSTGAVRFIPFTSLVTLQEGLSYYLTLKSGSTASNIFYFMTFANANAATAMHGNLNGTQTVQGISRQNSGTWTYSTTSRYSIGLMVRQCLNAGSVGASYVY
jgi:hypothetical protein